jgi:uncharacterized membrane protein
MKMPLFFHVLGFVVWVGGMFFAYVALRPAAAQLLDPPQRLSLWQATLRRFFGWVWIAVALVLASGVWMFLQMGGFKAAPLHTHAMFLTGLVMAAVFAYVYFVPFRSLSARVAAQEWKAGAAALGTIRSLVAFNLALGLITIAIATVGAVLV